VDVRQRGEKGASIDELKDGAHRVNSQPGELEIVECSKTPVSVDLNCRSERRNRKEEQDWPI